MKKNKFTPNFYRGHDMKKGLGSSEKMLMEDNIIVCLKFKEMIRSPRCSDQSSGVYVFG